MLQTIREEDGDDIDDTAKPFVLILSRVDWFGDVIRDRAAKDIAIKE